MHCAEPRSIHRRETGFSLVELAIVLLIVSILTSGVVVAVSEATGGARRSATLAQLRQIEEALYGFAQSQGRLPCPAIVGSNGQEFLVGGVCGQAEGFVPNATLGLYGQVNSNGNLVDSWQNPLRYSVVITADAGNPDFTDAASIRAFFNAGTRIEPVPPMLMVCSNIAGSACASAEVISDVVPAAVFSIGANASSFTSANEAENVDGDTILVSASYSEEQFDDQLIWLSPYVLFSRMISAGKLP